MKAILLCIFTLLGASHARSLSTSDGKPDTPPYEVKNSTKAYEVRQYESATWAVAFGKSRWSIDFAAQSAGLALAGYFKGANVDHTPIKPTIPVIGTVLPPRPPHPPPHPPHKNSSHHGNKTHPKPPHRPHPPHGPPGPPAVALAAYIPAKYEGKAPIPDSSRVKILKTNSTEVYVHKFGGWAISWVVRHEIGHLAAVLKDLKICPGKGKFFVATYDPPFKIFGRHNEILWVEKPKHKHHNDSFDEAQELTATAGILGLEAIDVEALFPDEFQGPEEAFNPEGVIDVANEGSAADLPDGESTPEAASNGEALKPWTLLQEYFEINEIEAASGNVQTA